MGLPCSLNKFKQVDELWKAVSEALDANKYVLSSFKPLKGSDENDIFLIKKAEERPYRKVFLKNIRYNIEQWLEVGEL